MTTTPPDWARTAAANIGRHAVMALVRTAAALMAAWSLYAVARHYGVPKELAVAAGLVFDGIAYLCLRSASDAIRAARSAAPSILATLGMATTSVYLNLVHADITHGGRPAQVLYASPAIGLLVVSALAWNADRATARAARGEDAFRLPSFGFWGWALAAEEATTAVRERAVAHVTSGASATHQPASALPARTAEDDIAAEFAEIGPAAAVHRVAAANPDATDEEIAETLATYQVTVTPPQVALLLDRAAVPTVRLDRVPQPAAVEEHPALDPARAMRRDAPQVSGMVLADAIATMSRHLDNGGLKAEPKKVVQALALQGMATDNAYVRTALGRARKAEQKAAAEAATQTERQRAEYERRHGNGGYA
ncbi:hypothetical protein [Streptomyces sp. LS1784]|uniref:hypothetical protein n=1 Tax=Streptomyces sp. LS1784 TaxID=2851533 RepID=UPI001CCB9CAA|nr:hypothetical protein [Streptomyces sp. LS1784]